MVYIGKIYRTLISTSVTGIAQGRNLDTKCSVENAVHLLISSVDLFRSQGILMIFLSKILSLLLI